MKFNPEYKLDTSQVIDYRKRRRRLQTRPHPATAEWDRIKSEWAEEERNANKAQLSRPAPGRRPPESHPVERKKPRASPRRETDPVSRQGPKYIPAKRERAPVSRGRKKNTSETTAPRERGSYAHRRYASPDLVKDAFESEIGVTVKKTRMKRLPRATVPKATAASPARKTTTKKTTKKTSTTKYRTARHSI